MEEALVRLARLLPEAAEALAERREELREVRLRAGRRTALCVDGGEIAVGDALTAERLGHILAALMDYSVHAREDELRQGFFTLADGCRVGVCGEAVSDGRDILALRGVGSVCLRLARSVPGCADGLRRRFLGKHGPRSTLLCSPPGMGKTTLLRDIARQCSEAGYPVGIADERHELAACRHGVPTADVGPRTDVMDGGPKAAVIPLLVRGMAPRVIVTDEIGGPGDAIALAEARRCGVAVMASCHGDGPEALLKRAGVREILEDGIFETIAVLGDVPGRVKAVYIRKDGEGGGAAWVSD